MKCYPQCEGLYQLGILIWPLVHGTVALSPAHHICTTNPGEVIETNEMSRFLIGIMHFRATRMFGWL